MKFYYQDTHLLTENTIVRKAQELIPMITHLNNVINSNDYTYPESSINLPSDMTLYDQVRLMVDRFSSPQPKLIIDIGIGGSNLGTKAVYDALYGYYDTINPNRYPKMIFLDTNDETYIYTLLQYLNTINNPEEIVINAISKSGETTETIANLEFVYHSLVSRFPDISNRVVITTDKGSKLEKRAQELEIETLAIPLLVGGRFSVLSSVGLFPLALCNIDTLSLRKGATDMRKICTSHNILQNPALISATSIYLQSQQGKTIHDTFIFLPQLESLGKWYRQLMGESIGKEHNNIGKTVHAGITPTVSIGSTDLHSVGQLYLGGPKDKMTTFVYSNTYTTKTTLPQNMIFPLVPLIGGKSSAQLMKAIRQGVQISYTKQNLPYISIELERLTPSEIGAFFQFKMIEMMYLGRFFEVNTFDQPHVELYKTETKRILQTN